MWVSEKAKQNPIASVLGVIGAALIKSKAIFDPVVVNGAKEEEIQGRRVRVAFKIERKEPGFQERVAPRHGARNRG